MSACYTEMEECRCDQEAGGVREKLCGSGPPLHLSPRLAKPIFRFHVASCSTLVFSLYARKIKWICPTAPTRPIGTLKLALYFAGYDALTPAIVTVKLGIGGFSMGAAAALYSATCFTHGDGVVPYSHGERSAEVLRMSGFRNLTFKTFNGYAPAAAATSYFHF
ncbi:hypothetical protein B296_00012172 [Ensete ventricosum]|uniref:Phospholipase/carboxylesterase/thioesterase domain-containing protein n=1 Tax=Ensete ventricosum TaxID=4639 RepID=A0A427ANR0_ENSVE|nr:hypothetical protein B296_00012172 [Ensete ventricosum]